MEVYQPWEDLIDSIIIDLPKKHSRSFIGPRVDAAGRIGPIALHGCYDYSLTMTRSIGDR